MLYTLASDPATYASAFHDIVGSGNYCDIGAPYCSAAGAASFNTGIGYDEATGLGSIDLNNLLTAWPKNTATNTAMAFTLGSAALSVTESSATAAASGTSAITITPVNGYTGTINWTVASSVFVSGACYSISNATVSGSSPVTATLTVSVGNGATCPSGTSSFDRKGTQSAAARTPAQPGHRSPTLPALATFGIVSLLFLNRRNRRLPTLLALMAFAVLGLGLSGCGGATTSTACTGAACSGGGGTSGGSNVTNNYTITVIGRDSATSSITANTTLPFTLTVQ
jgi:hypothetical protein